MIDVELQTQLALSPAENGLVLLEMMGSVTSLLLLGVAGGECCNLMSKARTDLNLELAMSPEKADQNLR